MGRCGEIFLRQGYLAAWAWVASFKFDASKSFQCRTLKFSFKAIYCYVECWNTSLGHGQFLLICYNEHRLHEVSREILVRLVFYCPLVRQASFILLNEPINQNNLSCSSSWWILCLFVCLIQHMKSHIGN